MFQTGGLKIDLAQRGECRWKHRPPHAERISPADNPGKERRSRDDTPPVAQRGMGTGRRAIDALFACIYESAPPEAGERLDQAEIVARSRGWDID